MWCTMQLNNFESLKTVGMTRKVAMHVRGASALFGTYTSLVFRIKHWYTVACEEEENHFTILMGDLQLTC